MQTTLIYFFDGELVRSAVVPTRELPFLSGRQTFWRGDAFTETDRKAMILAQLQRHFSTNGTVNTNLPPVP